MEDSATFSPPRQWGLVFHIAAILLLAGGGLLGLSQAARAQAGPAFLLYLLPGGVAVLLIPVLIYRAAALQSASYRLERDGIRLRWGLRSEDIPMTAVQWVGLAGQSPARLPAVFIGWPGARLGVRRLPDGRPLEFMASRASQLVLILTAQRGFAISPGDPAAFLQQYRRLAEYGSLSPIAARSVYPELVGQSFWSDRPARLMLLAAAAASLGLLAWVSLATPAYQQVSLRLSAGGSPLEPVPAVRLLLLPVLNSFFFVLDLLLGVVFYRHRATRPLAYLVWAASLLTALLFLAAVFFILRAA
jgi:hypothetical protein